MIKSIWGERFYKFKLIFLRDMKLHHFIQKLKNSIVFFKIIFIIEVCLLHKRNILRI